MKTCVVREVYVEGESKYLARLVWEVLLGEFCFWWEGLAYLVAHCCFLEGDCTLVEGIEGIQGRGWRTSIYINEPRMLFQATRESTSACGLGHWNVIGGLR